MQPTHSLFRLCISTFALVSFSAVVHHPPTAWAEASGSGSVSDDNIEAQVTYTAPPQEGTSSATCSWQKVRGIDPVTSGYVSAEKGSGPVLETLYFRECNNIIVKYMWIRNSMPAKAATVVKDKVSRLIPTLLARTAPEQNKVVVNVGTWFWFPRAIWKPISVTAYIPTEVGPISLTTTATPKKVIFSPGDGNKDVVCNGPGTPWTSSAGDTAKSDCSYTYSSASHTEASHVYKTKMSVEWAISFRSNLGIGGTIAHKRLGVTTYLRVFEKQALSR